MATNTWVRKTLGPSGWINLQQSILIAQLAAGQTLMRTRFAWTFAGQTSASIVIPTTMSYAMVWGLVTVIGTGVSSEVPDPISAPGDAGPPSQRWLWWEARCPQVAVYDPRASVVIWESPLPQEESDARGQVRAPTMGAGQSLDVWVTFKAQQNWDPSGQGFVSGWVSALVRSP